MFADLSWSTGKMNYLRSEKQRIPSTMPFAQHGIAIMSIAGLFGLGHWVNFNESLGAQKHPIGSAQQAFRATTAADSTEILG